MQYVPHTTMDLSATTVSNEIHMIEGLFKNDFCFFRFSKIGYYFDSY